MNTSPFTQRARAALNDANLQGALHHFKDGFQMKRAAAFAALPDAEALREAGRAIRDYTLSHLDDLLVQFEVAVTAQGGVVHWARDAAEARAIVTNILRERGAKAVTKGKSMVTEEIELNTHLIANGFTPIETDLGEYIIQLRDEKPSHIVAPAFHLKREQVEQSFRDAHQTLPPNRALPDRATLVAEARAMLRQHFEAADAGITGANFLVAETGTAMIVTNEGNGDLTRLLPRTHIVVTGIEKVIPSLGDAALLFRLLVRSATGQETTSYLSLMTGPKRVSDADGPDSFHIVLVDNGRSRMLTSPARDILRCIRCGACLNHCPVYGAIGGHAYGEVYPGPLGAALDPGFEGLAKTYDLPNATSACGRCDSVCPVKIPLTRIMRHWGNESFAQGLPSPAFNTGVKLWAFAARSPRLYRTANRLAAFALRRLAGRSATIKNLPALRGWFAVRDLPKPARKSFQAQWAARRAKRA